MFISYEYIGYLGFNPELKLHQYQYRVVDSEFETIDTAYGSAAHDPSFVIFTYERLNLPVVPNLMKSLIYYSKKTGYPVSRLIGWSRECTPKFREYEKELEKYMVLL
jgi:hypothetical protein